MTTKCVLADRECVPCKGCVPPLEGSELERLLAELGGDWELVKGHRLACVYPFPSYAEAVAFTNEVARIAEQQQHHPDIHLSYDKVRVEVWTHMIGGLSQNDFIFAAKVDALPRC